MTILVADSLNHKIRMLNQGTVSTLAGTGQAGHADGSFPSASFKNPSGIAVSKQTAIYVADAGNHVIRKCLGTVSTIGQGQPGTTDGPAGQAKFNAPLAVAVESATGKVLVADTGNHRIRSYDGSMVSTVCGSTRGFADGGPAAARFSSPAGIAEGSGGKFYIGDRDNFRVRVLANNQVSTLAGGGSQMKLVDGPAASARFCGPTGIAVDSKGWIYVADAPCHRIRVIIP
jgi:DNA-binding beta-propeller fold protein YncE